MLIRSAVAHIPHPKPEPVSSRISTPPPKPHHPPYPPPSTHITPTRCIEAESELLLLHFQNELSNKLNYPSYIRPVAFCLNSPSL